MKFFYKKQYSVEGQPFFLPLIDVAIGDLGIVALVDSGASYSLFHAALGEHIGLNIKAGQKFVSFGVDGKPIESFLHLTRVTIGGNSAMISISYSYDLQTPYPLLGQRGFFEKFRICFDLGKKEIEITPKFH